MRIERRGAGRCYKLLALQGRGPAADSSGMGLFFSLNAIPQLLGAAAILVDDPDRADRAWGRAERGVDSLGPLVDDDAASFVIGGANLRRAMRRVDDGVERLVFTRWLEATHAEASFPSGLVAI